MKLSDININNMKSIEMASQPISPPYNVIELMKANPYYGYITINYCDTEFVMFSANDDYVAGSFMWRSLNNTPIFEPYSLYIWRKLSTSSPIIFDIGSYTGIYSLFAAIGSPKSKIYTYEVLDRVYNRLLINKLTNKCGNININNIAMSDSIGHIDFNVYRNDSILTTGSSIISRNDSGIIDKKHIKATTIDNEISRLSLSRCDLIKMDVEGAETLVAKGMKNTIMKFEPIILIEILSLQAIDLFIKEIDLTNYSYYFIDDQTLSLSKNPPDIWLNLIFVPKRKNKLLEEFKII